MKREWYSGKLETLALAAGVGAALFDAGGEQMMLAGQGREFCRLALGDPECRGRCARFHADAGRRAADLGEVRISRCPLGAAVMTAPIVISGGYAGGAAFMPLRMDGRDGLTRAALSRAAEGLDIDTALLVRAAEDIPLIDGTRSGALAALLTDTVIPGLGDMEDNGLVLGRKRRISELMEGAEALSGGMRTYPLGAERELTERARSGDRRGARAVLNDLLGRIFYRAPGNMRLLKARVLELSAVLTRAAAEAGADPEELLGPGYGFGAELSAVNGMEELSAWIVRMLEGFLDAMERVRTQEAPSQLSMAIDYIKENYARGVTLEEAAVGAKVSPYYLSHLFRERLGVTFVEYLTSVRLEAARDFLVRTRLPVAAIAERVGYEDPGYFSRMFRRNMGMTPSQYRRSAGRSAAVTEVRE